MERKNLKTATRRARAFRAASTDAEHRLWSRLRGRQLDGAKFRRQFPIDRYFADFACVEAKLIVELDGSQHAARTDYDAERTRVLEACGWHVMRIWNNEVLENMEGVGLAILAELRLARG
jgi:very-short-patch-repair endonuclease